MLYACILYVGRFCTLALLIIIIIRTDGGYEGRVEGVLGEAEQDTRLADARVADEQQLEQIVVRLGHRVRPVDSLGSGAQLLRRRRTLPSLPLLVARSFAAHSQQKELLCRLLHTPSGRYDTIRYYILVASRKCTDARTYVL